MSSLFGRQRLALAAAAILWVPLMSSQPINDALVRARALADAGKLTEAEAALHDCIARDDSSADAHFLLGYVYFRERKARQSLAEFTTGARFRRPAADDFRVIASDYVLLADYADAEKWFTEVTLQKPDDAEAWYLLGRAQYNEDHFTTAIASFERALTLRPQFIEAENNMGLAWQGLNDPQRAMTAFETAVGWQQDRPADAQPYLNLGTVLDDQSQADKALPYLQEAARLAPKNPKIHEELGRAYDARHELAEAQRELEEAAALAPNASGLHFKLGQIYRREGLRDRAQEEFAICAKLNSTHSSMDTPNPFNPN
jgi:tetratricopeptide (TPR) repeat protein